MCYGHGMTEHAIDPRLWELCGKLVSFDTVADKTNVPAAEWAADVLDASGWQVAIVRDRGLGADKASVVAWTGPKRAGGLILSGHFDIVPWETQQGWTRHALELARDETRLYGRGVADMKGFVAGCLHLAERLEKDRLARPLAMVLTCDEEPGCLGIERQLDAISRELARIPTPAEAVLGEPTSGRVYAAHRGHVRVPFTIRGRAGHSSRPDLGVNAIDAACDAIDAVRGVARSAAAHIGEEEARLYPEHPATPFNVGIIRGGCAINMIPETCEVALGFRPALKEGIDLTLQQLRTAIAQRIEVSWPGAEVQFGEVIVTPPLERSADGRTAAALREIAGASELLGAPYATDAAHLQRLGIRCYIWGPGEIEQAHQPNESMPIRSLAELPDRLDTLVRSVCCSSSL